MSIELKQVAGRMLIYEGLEDDFYKTYSITLGNGVEISIPVFIQNRLKDMYNRGDVEIVNSITKLLNNITRNNVGNDLWGYQNEDGLTIYTFEVERYLVVVSKGEVNRGRYKIVLEGVFLSPLQTIS